MTEALGANEKDCGVPKMQYICTQAGSLKQFIFSFRFKMMDRTDLTFSYILYSELDNFPIEWYALEEV